MKKKILTVCSICFFALSCAMTTVAAEVENEQTSQEVLPEKEQPTDEVLPEEEKPSQEVLPEGEEVEDSEIIEEEGEIQVPDSEGQEVQDEKEEPSEQPEQLVEPEQPKYKGWHYDNGWYYYTDKGELYKGWLYKDRVYYYLDGNNTEKPGVMLANCSQVINGRTYFFNSSGVMLKGWVLRPEGWYHTDINGAMQMGWLKYGNYWYYLDDKDGLNPGKMLTNTTKLIGRFVYHLRGDGRMVTQWYYHRYSGGYRYYDQNGHMVTGWIKSSGKWYYLDPSKDGLMVSGCAMTITGYDYIFRKDGSLLTGWRDVPGEGYRYYDENGHQKTGWVKSAGKWYYLEPANDGIMLKNTWKRIGKYYYYLGNSGAMATHWLLKNGNYYYLAADGVMRTGWQYIGGDYYYFYPENDSRGYGIMARNTTINGWKIDSSGRMLSTEKSKMLMKAQMYSSPTGYLLVVDRANCKVGVFRGGKGFWSCEKFWDCSPGTAATPTISGIYHVGIKGTYFDSGMARCYWYTQILGDYLFHSNLYYQDGSIMDDRIGIPLSHGCVRLKIDNAKWIYDNIPTGTTIFIY